MRDKIMVKGRRVILATGALTILLSLGGCTVALNAILKENAPHLYAENDPGQSRKANTQHNAIEPASDSGHDYQQAKSVARPRASSDSSSRFLFEPYVGVSFLPLTEFRKRVDSTARILSDSNSHSEYNPHVFAAAGDLFVGYTISPKIQLLAGMGFIRSGVEYHYFGDEPKYYRDCVTDSPYCFDTDSILSWTPYDIRARTIFLAFPVQVAMRVTTPVRTGKPSAFAQFGLMYLSSRDIYESPRGSPEQSVLKGHGYGLSAGLGGFVPINRVFHLAGEAMFRYAEPFGFHGDHIKISSRRWHSRPVWNLTGPSIRVGLSYSVPVR